MIVFVYIGVMSSGECDVCDVTLSVHPRWESNPRPLGYQSKALLTELRSQVGSSLIPSISMYSMI